MISPSRGMPCQPRINSLTGAKWEPKVGSADSVLREGGTLLEIRGVETGTGKLKILRGIDMKVDAKGIVALLGGNGTGKSTLLRAISGLLPVWEPGLENSPLQPFRDFEFMPEPHHRFLTRVASQ